MSLVKTSWLAENSNHVKIIDCSWHMPQAKRNGFEEYKKDPKDNTGWFAKGHHAHLVFADIKSAKDAAIQHIHWLEGF